MQSVSPRVVGFGYALSAQLVWGFAPLFWRLLGHIAPPLLLGHRIVWALGGALLWIGLTRQGPALVAVLRQPRLVATLLGSAVLLCGNWLAFLVGVETGRVVEVSLGYYVTPLLSVGLGRLVLGESLGVGAAVAVGLAAAGVAVLSTLTGGLPWIAMVVAFCWASYSLLRKTISVDPVLGATVELILVTPFALGGLAWGGASPTDAWSEPLILATIPMTLVPLLWFVHGVRRLPLSTVGILQFVTPSLQFGVAVVVFGEVVQAEVHGLAFGLIWAGVVLFLGSRNRGS